MVRAFFPEHPEGAASKREPFPDPPPAPEGKHSMDRRVEWRDIDSVGHVNNAVYVAYIEAAGVDVARARGWPMERMMEMGFGILARRHRIEYRQQAVMGQALSVETWLSPPKRTSAIRHTVIRDQSEGEIMLRAETVWVWVDLRSGRPIRIPPYFEADFETNIAR
jgi:acyl-CoA thioester hydrolase